MVNLPTWSSPKLRRGSRETLRVGGSAPISPLSTPTNGFAHAHSVNKGQGKRKNPLSIFTSSDSASSRYDDGRKPSVISVYDAAIRSATDLTVNVTQNMLRSPLRSSPLPSRLRSARLAPIAGRPRSNTAPTTPIYDYPMEPIELPGSLPGPIGSNSSTDNLSTDDPYRLPGHRATSSLDTRRPSGDSPAHRDYPSSIQSYMPPNGAVELNATPEPPATASVSDSSSITRLAGPPTAIYHGAPSTYPTDLVPGSAPAIPTQLFYSSLSATPSQRQAAPTQQQPLSPVDSESALMDQIASIRNANDAQLMLVRESYEKQIASYRSYVQFLEKRRVQKSSSLQAQPSQQTLTNEPASTSTSKSSGTTRSETSTMDPKSGDSHEHKKRPSQDSSSDVDTLKRKLRDTVERGDRKISQLKDILRRYKESDQTLKSALADVEARLEVSNMERVDVLEGFNTAQEIIRDLSDREKTLLAKANSEATSRAQLETSTAVAAAGRKSEDSPSALKNDIFLQQLAEYKKTVKEKDVKIRELEQTIVKHGKDMEGVEAADNLRTIATLTRQLEDYQGRLRKAETERDQHKEVLRAELRRQSRYAIQNASVPLTPQIGAEASALANEKLELYPRSESGDVTRGASPDSQSMREDVLEKELQHAFSEIIAYKLDIRGYKKDLKHANATIQSLQAQATALQIPPTSETATSGSTKRRNRHASTSTSRTSSSKERRSGLGISLSDEPKAPTRSSTNATSTSFFSTRSAPVTNTSAQNNKTLPKLPSIKQPGSAKPLSRPSSPNQGAHPQRSLSESIATSGGKSKTAHKPQIRTPPTRGQSCEPVIESPRGVPTSKFSMAESLPAP